MEAEKEVMDVPPTISDVSTSTIDENAAAAEEVVFSQAQQLAMLNQAMLQMRLDGYQKSKNPAHQVLAAIYGRGFVGYSKAPTKTLTKTSAREIARHTKQNLRMTPINISCKNPEIIVSGKCSNT